MSMINKTICTSSLSRFAVLTASIIIAMSASYASSASGAFLQFGSSGPSGSSSTGIYYNLLRDYYGNGFDAATIGAFGNATVTSPVSFSGQTFDLRLKGSTYPGIGVGAATPTGFSGKYSETNIIFPYGFFSLTQGNGAQNLFSANISGMTIYAVPNSSSALIELNYTNASSNLLLAPPSASGYIDMTGSKSSAVTLVTNTASTYQEFNNFALDWSGQVTSTPYSVSSSVPEPSELALMLGGLGLIGFIARHKKGKIA